MPRRALSFYIGLALVTAGTLALEIVQTRLLSVVSWYHLAFFVISVAMFGMTLGALTVFLRPTRFTAASVDRDLALYALWAGVATGLAYLDQSVLAPEMVLSASAITVFTRLAITVSIPFFFSGICVTLALTRTRFPIAKSYGADLVGAAAGCLLVIPLLGWLDGPGAVFSCGAIMALGAVLFATRAEASRLAVWAFVVAALWMAVAYANSRTVYGLDPIIVKGQAEKRHRVAYEKWNSFSRVVAYRPAKETPTNLLWAPSMTVRGHREKFDYVQMNIDGLAGAKIIGLGSVKSPEDLSFLGADTTAIAYAMRKGDVAVIGVGGGKDLATALATGQNSVLGVEINPALVGAISGPYRELADLVGHSKVRIETDEARSYMTRDDGQYDIVQASLIDTWAATGAGAFTLSENSIYTVQAWRIFLDRLAPGGIFTVSRWYAPERVDETARLVSLALGTLFKRGVETPADHILLAAHDQVATILVSNEPFSPADIETFRTHCVEMRFDILMTPAAPPTDPTLASLAAATSYRDLTKIAGRYPLDISPPTDARPFFFNLLRLSRPWEIASYLGTPAGVVAGNLIATLTLLTIILVTLVLGVATVAIPWRFANRATPEGVTNRRPSASALAYFALIGFGFMFVEIGLLQRLSVFLGHPVHALAIVLFSLILFTGGGSLLNEPFRLTDRANFRRYILILVGYLLAMQALLPLASWAFQSFGLFGRATVAILLIAPAGLLMGQAFPTGMALVRSDDTDPTPWLWGINGAAGVIASALAAATSIAFGIPVTLLVGTGCYALLSVNWGISDT